jgi:hypothetical protein
MPSNFMAGSGTDLPPVVVPTWFAILTIVLISAAQQLLIGIQSSLPKFGAGNNATFMLMTDLDKRSYNATEGRWNSIASFGILEIDSHGLVELVWDVDLPDKQFSSDAAVKGRAMEVSALEYYDSQLLGFCDRTGFVYNLQMSPSTSSIVTQFTTPRQVPFKSEWATIKGDALYVGSNGKEWVENGVSIHEDFKYIRVFEYGVWRSENWTDRFEAIRRHLKCEFPGYLIHEAVAWDSRHSEWLFLPRKVSLTTPYDELADEHLSGNILVRASEDFSLISSVSVGPFESEWGFTDIKILPRELQSKEGSNPPTLLVGVKVREVDGEVSSKITVFDTEGNIRLLTPNADPFLPVGQGQKKYEAISFIPRNIFAANNESVTYEAFWKRIYRNLATSLANLIEIYK